VVHATAFAPLAPAGNAHSKPVVRRGALCHRGRVSAGDVKQQFHSDGFVVLPAFLSHEELQAATADLPAVFPTAAEFHRDPSAERHRRFRDEFGGITSFPIDSTALNLLAVHPRLIGLAQMLLADDDLRSYSIEFWAKYTGAADYEQAFHRDYLNHTLLVPADDAPPSQVEMFVYLSDVSPELGPISLLPRAHAAGAGALPNWYPPSDGVVDPDHPEWVSPAGRPDWYEHEVRATGPAGTVVAYRIETFHRGTDLRLEGGSRFTIHTNFRRATSEWITRRAWTDAANDGSAWTEFVGVASPPQLQLFGFPPPGHPYWTSSTIEAIQQRYPGLDPTVWH
jgi:hypothetical protein